MPGDSKHLPKDSLAFGRPRAAISLIASTVPRRRRRLLLMLLLASLTLALVASVYSRTAIAAPYPPDAEPPGGWTGSGTLNTDPPTTTPVDTDFPLPNLGNLQVHDPNILSYNGTLYLFKGAVGIDYFKATNISGPWTQIGTVLTEQSIIDKPDINRQRQWAPTTIEHNNTFYCFYAVTSRGTRNSAIGVATSTTLEAGSWTDHGAVFNTYNGTYADIYPFTVSNAIDPAAIVDPVTGKPWITYGSFWTDIWQLPLTDDLMAIQNPSAPTANHLSYMVVEGQPNTLLDWYPLNIDPQGSRAEEGSYISYHEPYYYLWYSRGKCCKFNPGKLPPQGAEYSIHVGRSTNITGPYVDVNGVDLVNGGGQIVYGSNHDNAVYAPGGLGVLTVDDGNDLLYYHYLNKSIGYGDHETQLGWSVLIYENGWPVVSTENTTSSIPSAAVRLSPGLELRSIGYLITVAWIIFYAL